MGETVTKGDVFTAILELFATSQVTQGLITVVCLAGTFAMLLNGLAVPEWVVGFDALVIGTFFGGKIGASQARAAISKQITEAVNPKSVKAIRGVSDE